jgi:hypothetical protein
MSAKTIGLTCVVMTAAVFLSGCVERKLTINTEPQGALIVLNDEEVGTSPVTVAFNWYGDYSVRINKEGYQSLITHKNLKRPARDAFPLDFYYEVLHPGRIVDEYEWSFALTPYKPANRDELLKAAQTVKEQAALPMDQAQRNLVKDLETKRKKKR